MTRIAVVIPTVNGRERDLERCLAAVHRQTRSPDEICVVRDFLSLVSALRDGWTRTSSDWIAFLDDDSIPQSNWLEQIARHFDDPAVAAVGGRILTFVEGRSLASNYSSGPVAHLSWFGRTVSRLQDIPAGPLVCDAHFLQGSNMCVRRAALREISDALDYGMAPGLELALCLELRRAGWKVRFDSEALVTHYPAPRPKKYVRGDRVRYAREYSYILTSSLLRWLSWPRKISFALYFFLIGQRESPGLLMAPYFLLPGRNRARLAAAWRGKWEGLWDAWTRA